MKSKKKKVERVALIEVDGSHDECLLTQIYALKRAQLHVTLICTDDINQRNPHFEPLVDRLCIIDRSKKHNKIVREILKLFRTHRIELAIFNTAQGAKVRDISVKLYFSKIQLVGIIHTTKKFGESFRQKVINLNMKKYFLLSAYLFHKVTPPSGIRASYFYPIRFPEFPTARVHNEKLTISIIGGVENRRKDLDGFMQLLKSVEHEKIQFVFLGKSEDERMEVKNLKNSLQSNGLLHLVKFYDDFVEPEAFDKQLKQTDILLPLVHPETPSAEQYFKNQISGAANVAFGYGIPLLMHEAYQNIHELKNRAIFYNLSNFSNVIASIRPELESITNWMQQDTEMTYEVQENRYLDFLFNS